MLDVIAGSSAEKSLVESLAMRLELEGVSVEKVPIEVLEWGEVECSVNDIGCTAQPPVESAEVSGILGEDVALASTTRDPDNVWVTYWLSASRGASAVVLYDEYPGVGRRRIVVNEVPSYSLETEIVAEKPAVHLPLTALPKLRRAREVSIRVKTFRRTSLGYVVDAVVGPGEPKVAVVTHHDRWLTGFRDSSIGVLILLRLARLLRSRGLSARLISFTAEELGDPARRSFYWAYGSRAYLDRMGSELDLDLAVVLDTAYAEPVNVDCVGVRGVEPALSFVKSLGSSVGAGYTDAVSMVNSGIPSVVLHNLDSIKPVYHSDVDRYPGRYVEGFILKTARSIANLVEEYKRGSARGVYAAYVEYVRRVSPPDSRGLLEPGADPVGLSKCLAKHYTVPVLEGTYSDFYSEVKVLTYSEILRGIMDGRRYTLLYEDAIVSSGDAERLRKLSRAALEEAVRCSRS